MLIPKTFIIVKNIPLEALEILLQNAIATQQVLNDKERILVKMKNSRLFILTFPQNILVESFDILVKEIALYNENQVSFSEIVAVYDNQVEYLKSEVIPTDFSIDQILTLYKLNKGVLHVMLNLKNAIVPPKKWWQFWK
nr:hypothetical protein [uncultured Flavobacterium sp.]